MSRYCPDCHQEIGLGKNKMELMDCPRCLAEKGYSAMLEVQKLCVPQVLAGKLKVILTKAKPDIEWHVAMLYYPKTSWCGQEMKPKWEKRATTFSGITETLCSGCREVFERMEKAA